MIELGVPPGIVPAEAAFSLDGEPEPRLTPALVSLTVAETIEGLYRCEARFTNWGDRGNGPDYLYFDRDLLDFGKEISVILGAGDEGIEAFKGRITALEGQFLAGEPPQIVVLAEDAAQALRQTRRTRTFEDVTDGEVFEQIANDHGLQPEIDLTDPPRLAVIAQLNQSDLAFLRSRARRLAAEIWIEGTTLHVQGRQARQQSDEQLVLALNRGLLEFSVIADTVDQYTQVVVSGWDVQAKERLEHEADDSLLSNELEGLTSGASVVSEAFGDRPDRIAQQMPLTATETQAIAEASFRAQARRFVVGTGKARGDARLRVGRAIELQGLGPLFSGLYTVSEVHHSFSRQPGGGYLTEFVVERPGLGA
jgi:phage protein D